MQWCMGLLLLGWGVAILVGIVPHEDLLVGAGLAALGGALCFATRRVPAFPRIPALLLAGLGAVLLVGALAFSLTSGWALPKLAIALLGVAFLGLAPFQARKVRLRGHGIPVATLSASLVPFALGPVAIYAAQALFRHGTGTTPLEAFLATGLIAPVAALLAMLGWSPQQDGQMLTYMTPSGPLRLEVGVACSGLQAMALFAGMLALLVAVERPPPRLAALLVAVGMVGVYVSNLVRLVGLAFVGYNTDVETLEQAHAQAGWILFVAWALLFATWAKRKLAASRETSTATARTPAKATAKATATAAPASE